MMWIVEWTTITGEWDFDYSFNAKEAHEMAQAQRLDNSVKMVSVGFFANSTERDGQ